MITIVATEVNAEQRLRMLRNCVQTLHEQDDVDRELLMDAANWTVIAEALKRALASGWISAILLSAACGGEPA
ncbi:hypothetical protein ACFV2N_48550 [Streptomyces sp. NPDC059680]|uniref:hypothetical protein n=1 Tax=Streptomyces sp. NPDC059680 TaxID=3346904 RepID=UPI0036BDC6C5